MALNFPNSPALNDVYIDTTSGFSYQWNGTVWISFSAASSSQIKVLDDISGSFTGIAFTFALTSSSASISPPNAQSLIINLGGVIQDAPTAADQACALGNRGVTKCVAGAPVTAGTLIMSNGSGRGVLATTGLFFIGRALTGAGADGQIFELLLGVNGYVP